MQQEGGKAGRGGKVFFIRSSRGFPSSRLPVASLLLEDQGETGAPFRSGEVDAAAARLGDGGHDRQAEPRPAAVALGGEEAIPDAVLVGRADAGAAILDADREPPRSAADDDA